MAKMRFTDYTEAGNNFCAAVCQIIGDKTFNFFFEVTSQHTRPLPPKWVPSKTISSVVFL